MVRVLILSVSCWLTYGTNRLCRLRCRWHWLGGLWAQTMSWWRIRRHLLYIPLPEREHGYWQSTQVRSLSMLRRPARYDTWSTPDIWRYGWIISHSKAFPLESRLREIKADFFPATCTTHVDINKCFLNTCGRDIDTSRDTNSVCTSSTWCIEKQRTEDEKDDCSTCGCPTIPWVDSIKHMLIDEAGRRSWSIYYTGLNELCIPVTYSIST